MWVQDRFDDGRRVAERALQDGRKLAECTLRDGRTVAKRSLHDGRKVAENAYGEGRDVAGRTYLDGRREAEHRFDKARHEAEHRVDQARRQAGKHVDEARRQAERRLHEGRDLVAHRLDDGRKVIGDGRRAIRDRFGDRAPVVEAGVVAGAIIWPTLMLAAGASVAYFCWSQYMRGRAERQARALDEQGGEGPAIPKPELVMAHNAAPKPQGAEAVDPSDSKLAEPAEELMLHAPLDDAPPQGSSLNAMKAAPRAAVLKRRPAKPATAEAKAFAEAATAAAASRPTALDESLAVQGAASASKRQSPNGATPSATPERKGGPTIM